MGHLPVKTGAGPAAIVRIDLAFHWDMRLTPQAALASQMKRALQPWGRSKCSSGRATAGQCS